MVGKIKKALLRFFSTKKVVIIPISIQQNSDRVCGCQPATSWASEVATIAFWTVNGPIFEYEYELREKIATKHNHLIPFLS